MNDSQSVSRPIKGFKSKTITKILTGKFIAWSKSIDDEAVRKLVEENTIITGGSITSMLLGEPVNDFDVYFRTSETALAVAEYYVKKLKANPPTAFAAYKDKITASMEEATETHPARVKILFGQRALRGESIEQSHGGDEFVAGQVTDTSEPGSYEGNTEELDDIDAKKITQDADEKKRGKYRVMFVTANAITLSDDIQIVLRFSGDAAQIHKNFDFVHCLSFWESKDRKLTVHPEAALCCMARELKYQGSLFPLASVIRTRKFLTRGWSINAGQYLRMLFQVSKLDLTDAAVLEEQLVGVDSAYFSHVIAKLKESVDVEGKPVPVDEGHLFSIIDKIF
jgi:hypothetical protein